MNVDLSAGRNRLGEETSPYLLQHKDNPVHWWPWSDAAFAAARAADRPILLSVGYAACHWCHVMAHESFEDDDIAAVMNQRFVNIKVDREERPDVDAIYQKALALMEEQGGWPLTMFLSPDGRPFWGGTYFPPVRRPTAVPASSRCSTIFGPGCGASGAPTYRPKRGARVAAICRAACRTLARRPFDCSFSTMAPTGCWITSIYLTAA